MYFLCLPNIQYIFYFVMKAVLLLLLLEVAMTNTYFRLSSIQNDRLDVGDSLISTLGEFKATLQGNDCSLLVERFNHQTNHYQNHGVFKSPVYVTFCNYIAVRSDRIITSNNSTYLSVDNLAYNHSTIFMIDDQAVLRLISTYIMPNIVDLKSEELVFRDLAVDPQYLRAYSQLNVQFGDSFQVVSNKRNWRFTARFGQLTISFADNPSMRIDYVYSSVMIRDLQIFDFTDSTFPGAIYNNITFHPRCLGPRAYLNFKPPYVFAIDPYWPIVHIYEQGRYEVATIAFGDLPQYDFQQEIKSLHFAREYSPCPARTFEHEGRCLALCPAPFYHEMRGEAGKCVLTCEQFTPRNQTDRTCSCFTAYEENKLNLKHINQCGKDAQQTPYGCRCNETDLFFDTQLTFQCVKICPTATYPFDGVCMACPQHCTTCQEDNYYRRFLECQQCEDGYQVHEGQCVRTCVSNYGLTLSDNGICVKCTVEGCVSCPQNKDTCEKCELLKSLQNNECKDECSLNYLPVYAHHFSTVCLPTSTCQAYLKGHYNHQPFLKCDECTTGLMHKDTCTTQCPDGYTSHNNMFCVCKQGLTIGNECVDEPACPITMSFDIRSHSCMSCPFGCMSCINSQCTSCSPGYYLYISPQSILCRRKSPLFPCDKQYEWVDETCVLIQYDDSRLSMRECVQKVGGCRVCIPRSQDNCVMCEQEYYLYNNTCIMECPQKTIPYMNTCILPEIEHCEIPHLLSVGKEAIVTANKSRDSAAYDHYTYFGRQPANDPVGYIPYFQYLTTGKHDGIPRQTHFFQPQWTCHKCAKGYGLSLDHRSCRLCPQPCITCYYADTISCLTRKNIITEDCGYIDTEINKCVGNCTDPLKFPELEAGVLYCKPSITSSTKDYLRVDSSIFPFDDGSGSFVFFAFADTLTNYSGFEQDLVIDEEQVKKVRTAGVVGARVGKSTNEIDYEKDYIKITNHTSPYYLLNLTGKLSQLQTENKLLFPNSIYGADAQNLSHNQFITTWLAYIGYIMSITLIALHIVFIGNELQYKVDHILIMAQTIFYFSFVKNLVGKLLGQFYFGWSFAHGRFMPNLFNINEYIPIGYIENNAPLSFKLVNVDANYFRNAGFSLVWMCVLVSFFAFLAFILWAVSNLAGKKEMWSRTIAVQTITALVEFFSYNLLFFSMTQLYYGADGYFSNQEYFERSQATAIITLVLFSIYTIARFFFNVLGGMYMVKRFLLALVLMGAYNNLNFMIPVLALELIFGGLRLIVEEPETKMEKIIILIETGLFIAAHLLLFLCLDAGVNTILLSIIVFIFIAALAFDLSVAYLQSRHEYLLEQDKETIDGIKEQDQDQPKNEQRFQVNREYLKNDSAI